MKLIQAGVCHPGGACSKMNHSDKVTFPHCTSHRSGARGEDDRY